MGEESPFTYKTVAKSGVTIDDAGYYQCTGIYERAINFIYR